MSPKISLPKYNLCHYGLVEEDEEFFVCERKNMLHAKKHEQNVYLCVNKYVCYSILKKVAFVVIFTFPLSGYFASFS